MKYGLLTAVLLVASVLAYFGYIVYSLFRGKRKDLIDEMVAAEREDFYS